MKTYSCLLFAACAGASLMAPFTGQAMPLARPETAEATSPLVLADYDEHGKAYRKDDRHGGEHRRHHDNEDRDAAYGSARNGDDDDHDHNEGGRDARSRSGRGANPGNATPPANGLFTPGSKPRVQTN